MTGRRSVLAAVLAAPIAARAAQAGRIVSIGGSVTETVFALGAGENVVAVDSTSRFPAQVRALPQVGYMRALAPEGLVGLRPDLVLLSEDAGPAQAIAVLRAAGTPLATIPEAQEPEAVMRKIAAVAAALGTDGASLAAAVRADWALLDAPIAALQPVRAMFVLSAARGAPLVAGQGTQADAMLRSAGAVNAVSGFTGYRPLSAEAAAQAAPEAVVMMDHAIAESGGVEALLGMPALAVTPVARNRRILVVDGSYVLGFGPRAAHARRDLARLVHPGAMLPDLPARAWA
ncbi:heme/hemin ABC transporter substrate-binding protein [Roseomonas fluvialis]|uniref:Hemin ABC transporter substrate-binding protein n=1 Tax=Roseomonas fluvialis TaxID=1750527 RepID=A0ABN6NVG3_9PROT|nr:ABC transporter substrate-binding protein [Roseomonas fluvialis]BDG70419.1 hemin ABC transporter substrate-binding protein [Roseomonas fluvialis]